jgi:hypothetical protein
MDSVVLDALREAVRQERAIPLVKVGKGRAAEGLFPKRTKPYGEAIKRCLDKDHGFLEVVREERKGKTVRQFVRISERGLDALAAHLPIEEYGRLVAEAAPVFRGQLLELCLRSVRDRLGQSEEQRVRLAEVHQRMVAATADFMGAYVRQLEEEQRRVGGELAAALEARNRLADERAAYESAAARANEGQPTRIVPLAFSEADLNFQRDISEELVYAWQNATSSETQAALARVLLNVGVERIGEAGERVEFDGRWHHSDDELHPGDPAKVVRHGWRLANQRGNRVLARAHVKAVPDAKGTPA